MAPVKICVLGAGVIGLGSALCVQETLQELGLADGTYQIDVVAEKFSPDLTSDVAAGLWEPYLDAVSRHSHTQLAEFYNSTWEWMRRMWRMSLAPDTGLQLIHGYLLTDPGAEEPEWRHTVLDWHAMTPDELAMFPGYQAGFGFTTFICQPTKYMAYLTQRLKVAGVKFIKRRISDLIELSDVYDIVVNCTGAGANQLVRDNHVIPIRGQVVRVKAPWVKVFVADTTTGGSGSQFPHGYVLPNVDFCVLGGTADVGEWDLTPSPQTTRNIITKCSQLIPGLEKAEVISSHCGLRPGRFNLKIESERIKTDSGRNLTVVHNYGHGGIGVTLQMGTCQRAAQLVRNAVKEIRSKSKL